MTASTMQPYTAQHTGSLTLQQAQEQYNALVEFTRSVLKDGLDYGKVPGVSKPSLLKPGAEKLASLYRLRPSFELVTCREDWDSGFFYYHYRCKLTRDGEFMGEAEGSCNTKEKKYRYRNAERVCPNCGKPTIIKGKADYGGGYICFAKKGGCGAKFKDGAPEIEAQEVGQVENPDIYDAVNTVQKMAQKRALVAAVLITTGASEFFTQDVEDLQTVNVEYAAAPVVTQEAKASSSPQQPQEAPSEVQQESKPTEDPESARRRLYGPKLGNRRNALKTYGVTEEQVSEELAKLAPWYASDENAENAVAALTNWGMRLKAEHEARLSQSDSQPTTTQGKSGTFHWPPNDVIRETQQLPPHEEPVDAEFTPADETPALIHDGQRKALMGYLKRAKVADTSEARAAFYAFMAPSDIQPGTNTNSLTFAQARGLLEVLGKMDADELAATGQEFNAQFMRGQA